MLTIEPMLSQIFSDKSSLKVKMSLCKTDVEYLLDEVSKPMVNVPKPAADRNLDLGSVDEDDENSESNSNGQQILGSPNKNKKRDIVGQMVTAASSPDQMEMAWSMDCRSIRGGSYKVLPKDSILISGKGIEMKVPTIRNNMEVVTIMIPMNDVLKVLAHLGKFMPILFLYISPGACKRIRSSLSMYNNKSFFFDIASQGECS